MYGEQDALFGPEFANKLAAAWQAGGAPVEMDLADIDHVGNCGLIFVDQHQRSDRAVAVLLVDPKRLLDIRRRRLRKAPAAGLYHVQA